MKPIALPAITIILAISSAVSLPIALRSPKQEDFAKLEKKIANLDADNSALESRYSVEMDSLKMERDTLAAQLKNLDEREGNDIHEIYVHIADLPQPANPPAASANLESEVDMLKIKVDSIDHIVDSLSQGDLTLKFMHLEDRVGVVESKLRIPPPEEGIPP